MLINDLIQLGLSQKEAKIYLACLELGPSGIVQLAKKTKESRTSLYLSLEKLISKKLLNISIKGSRKIYSAEHPEKLKLFIQEKLNKANNILPELVSLIGKGEIKPKIKYFEGVGGIQNITRKILNSNDNQIIGFTGLEALTTKSKVITEFWEKEIIPKRKKLNKFLKTIVPDNETGKQFKNNDPKGYRETRLVPSSTYNFECEILIFDHTLIFISYSKNEEFALSLESKTISNTSRMIWHICWNSAY